MDKNTTTPTTPKTEYELGRPAGIEATVSLLVDEVARLTASANVATVAAPCEPQDSAETPDTNVIMDHRNFQAKPLSIRTDKDGNYRWTRLEALEDIPKPPIAKGDAFRLKNKNWESEFKRAQSAEKNVCLRIDGKGQVQDVEVLT